MRYAYNKPLCPFGHMMRLRPSQTGHNSRTVSYSYSFSLSPSPTATQEERGETKQIGRCGLWPDRSPLRSANKQAQGESCLLSEGESRV
jgi:hypothetical protein